MLFYYLDPLQNDSLVTSRCMQLTFGDKREVYLLDKSALPVSKKESLQEGNKSIGPRIKIKNIEIKNLLQKQPRLMQGGLPPKVKYLLLNVLPIYL